MQMSCKKLANIIWNNKEQLNKCDLAVLRETKTEKELCSKIKDTCESYGKKTCAYLLMSGTYKNSFALFCGKNNIKINLNYDSVFVVEIPVSYFKATGYDE